MDWRRRVQIDRMERRVSECRGASGIAFLLDPEVKRKDFRDRADAKSSGKEEKERLGLEKRLDGYGGYHSEATV